MLKFVKPGSFFLLCFILQFTGIAVNAQGREEFNGPFDSWANVRTRFGARGNGKDDDTRAFQTAIDSLSCLPAGYNTGANRYTVIYLPAGTYCISSTLVLRGKIGVSIIGEDPVHTIIKWTGADKDTILWTNGSAYFKIARLNWDANGRKGMEGIGIHWKDKWNDGKSRSYASCNIEISDNIFTGGFGFGISGGTFTQDGTGANDSEITIRRCTFNNCSLSGIEIHGYNALDYWIWDCRFLNCQVGITCARGNYHAYRSFFSGSKVCDVHNDNGYYISVRGCYSEKPYEFSIDAGSSSNPFKRVFQDNTIVSPYLMSVEYYHLGKITLMGNKFFANTDTACRVSINYKGWAPGNYEVLSLHNTYAYPTAVRIATAPAKLYTSGDNINSIKADPGADQGADPAAFLKTMDPTPLKKTRKVLEVPVNADAAAIQSILNQASKLRGQRPVVHFATGVYTIDRTLEIPAGSDMQLTGDGLLDASVIMRKRDAVFAGTPMFHVQGPSYINIQDIQIGIDGDIHQSPGILFQSADQKGARAHLDQIYSHADTSLAVLDMNYLCVQKENSFFNDGNYISGGSLVEKGAGTAQVNCFGGQFARVSVQQNARFLAKDCWWEGGPIAPIDLEGSGTVCVDGSKIAPANSDSSIAIRIRKFKGHICLMNMYVQGGLWIRPDNPDLNILAWNIHFYHLVNPMNFQDKNGTYKGAFLGLTSQCANAKDPVCGKMATVNDQWQDVRDTTSFLDLETAYDRVSRPELFKDLPAGISNIRLSRVSLGAMTRGVVFAAGK
jgi:pectate lyase-like protein